MATGFILPITITCDVEKNTVSPEVISVNQNENGIKKIEAVFTSGGKAWDLPVGCKCNIMMKKADGFAVINPYFDLRLNTVQFDITSQMTAVAGENLFQIQVELDGDELRSFSAVLDVKKAVLDDDDVVSGDEKETIDQLLDKAENAIETMEAAEAIVNRWQNIPAGDFDNFYVRAGLKAGTVAGSKATAEGSDTTASGMFAHAEGLSTIVTGAGGHAEGAESSAIGATSHAEGSNRGESGSTNADRTIDHTIIPDLQESIVVKGPTAYKRNAHAEGCQTLAYGAHSHAEGMFSVSAGAYSHAEGNTCYAVGNASHAEGSSCTASGGGCHAEGDRAVASGSFAHAEGGNSLAQGDYSHAECMGTIANRAQHATGKYNNDTAGPTSAGSTDGSLLVVGNGTSTTNRSNAFRVATSGAVYGSGAYNSSGADYAEMFEWTDGNSQTDDRRGLFVTLDGDKIRLANKEDDYILGVVSACPSVLGDSFFGDVWHNKYQRDIFGALLTETVEVPEQVNDLGDMIPTHTEVHYIENPEYDPELQYVPRTERPEWAPVGMLGKLVVVDNGSCQINSFCSVGQNGVATASENGYRVIARVDKNHIKIIFR